MNLNLNLKFYSLFHGHRFAGNSTDKFIGENSRASKGNLLEAINMSLNVFETLYIDCNLEETNCSALVITPSTGVFEVSVKIFRK